MKLAAKKQHLLLLDCETVSKMLKAFITWKSEWLYFSHCTNFALLMCSLYDPVIWEWSQKLVRFYFFTSLHNDDENCGNDVNDDDDDDVNDDDDVDDDNVNELRENDEIFILAVVVSSVEDDFILLKTWNFFVRRTWFKVVTSKMFELLRLINIWWTDASFIYSRFPFLKVDKNKNNYE